MDVDGGRALGCDHPPRASGDRRPRLRGQRRPDRVPRASRYFQLVGRAGRRRAAHQNRIQNAQRVVGQPGTAGQILEVRRRGHHDLVDGDGSVLIGRESESLGIAADHRGRVDRGNELARLLPEEPGSGKGPEVVGVRRLDRPDDLQLSGVVGGLRQSP